MSCSTSRKFEDILAESESIDVTEKELSEIKDNIVLSLYSFGLDPVDPKSIYLAQLFLRLFHAISDRLDELDGGREHKKLPRPQCGGPPGMVDISHGICNGSYVEALLPGLSDTLLVTSESDKEQHINSRLKGLEVSLENLQVSVHDINNLLRTQIGFPTPPLRNTKSIHEELVSSMGCGPSACHGGEGKVWGSNHHNPKEDPLEVLVLGDSFSYKLNEELRSILPRKFIVSQIRITDATLDVLLDSLSTRNYLPDYLVISAGYEDISYNEVNKFKRALKRLCFSLDQLKLIFLGVAFNYLLPAWSVINNEVFKMNKFLNSLANRFPHVPLVQTSVPDKNMILSKRELPFYNTTIRGILCKQIRGDIFQHCSQVAELKRNRNVIVMADVPRMDSS
ncbi:hypothetical protein GE061_015896 [Apolygus lucorum]|uniref:OSK domain-containing protein n=1 Tax=Apolygus lucorum TaxID=248454 RepID=A0A8S9XM96_APOLU|nr:hypothetical protein GE061_015896 [Apolygus lucorum]